MKEKIIITGATGFIGRRVIKEIIKYFPKENILCLIKDEIDALEISGRKTLEDLGINTKEVDLVSGRGLDNLPLNAELIIHLAASTNSADKNHDCNDIGTKNLLNALSPLSKDAVFIFTSTMAVYSGRKDLDIPVDEHTKAHPSNEYGRSKIKAEKILKDHSAVSGYNCTVLRLATVWGERTRQDGLFDVMGKLIRKKSLISRLNWPGRTSLIHVDNVVQIIMHLTNNISPEKFRILILSNEALTLSDISKLLHLRYNIKYVGLNFPSALWKIIAAVNKNNLLEKILPASHYNTFWRLNVITTDSLYGKPLEVKDKLKDLNIEMIDFR